MTIRYLLDTNVLSEPLRPHPNDVVIRRLSEYRPICVTTSIVWHELWFGCLRLPTSLRRERIEHYLLQMVQLAFPILPYDERAATWYAAERARLTALGLTPSYADGQIAAVAAVNGLILVTHNPAHFQYYAGLQIEDWRTPQE